MSTDPPVREPTPAPAPVPATAPVPAEAGAPALDRPATARVAAVRAAAGSPGRPAPALAARSPLDGAAEGQPRGIDAVALVRAEWLEAKKGLLQERQKLNDCHRRERLEQDKREQELEDRYRRERHEQDAQRQALKERHRRESQEQDERYDHKLNDVFLKAPPQTTLDDDSRPRCFGVLGEDFRLRILGFLGPDDLAEAAVVSRQFRDDCRHPSLPQERLAVIRIPPDCRFKDRLERVGTRLIAMATVTLPGGRRKFKKYSRLRIVDPHQPASWISFWRPPNDVKIPEIKSLDWSGEDPESGLFSWPETREFSCLAPMLPNLLEVDFSHARTACHFTLHQLQSHKLKKITWHGHWRRLRLTGENLGGCLGLRELYMDGACFDGWPDCDLLLFWLQDRLERVSIMGARCDYSIFFDDLHPKQIPQSKLIQFVRDAKKLRWFRSDLTSENVAMLQRERPDVFFAPVPGESGFRPKELKREPLASVCAIL